LGEVQDQLSQISSIPASPMSAMTHGILTFTHTIIQKQLVLKISGIHPKIPLIQSNMYGQGSRIQGMMKAHLP
jgi:hypothetical protein